MKSFQKNIALLLGAACLILAVGTVIIGRKNSAKQAALQQQAAAIQNEARSVQSTDQMSQDVLKELGNMAVTNDAVRLMLEKNGYTLNKNDPSAKPVAPSVGAALPAKLPELSSPVVGKTAPKAEVVTPPVSVPDEPVVRDAVKEVKP